MMQTPSRSTTGAAAGIQMQDVDNTSKANIRLAIILGVVALGFFVLGLYLSMGGGE